MDRVVRQSDLKKCALVDLEALACVRGCLTRFFQGRVGAPAFMALPLAAGGADVALSGGPVEGLYTTALRVEGRSVSGGDTGLLLLSPETGEIQALLLDEGYLADLGRALAAAAGLAASRAEGAISAFLVGADPTSSMYLQAMRLVREVTKVAVWDEDLDRARAGAAALEEAGFVAQVVAEPDKTVADVVLALGAAPAPEALAPGTTVIARPQEPWSPTALERLGFCYADDPDRSLLGASEPLGALTATKYLPAPDPDEVTLIELTDHPMLDTALGFLAWRKSQKYKLGTVIGPDEA